MSFVNFCNKVIEYSFYALFLLVPLVFAGNTSELFELNKMWLTWGLTIIIGATWFTKMVSSGEFKIQRTLLDIPILLFLSSQILSTIFSWDRHISFWGYYSRFNGGLLSTITYIFLYYAFVSNIGTVKAVWRILFVSLISGLIVALWGLPSHFGYDPTCYVFRGTFDVSCWTADFLPKVRIFSTLGQPAWLAAYLAVLIPIAIAFAIKNSKSEAPNPKQYQNSNDKNSKRFEHSIFENLNLFRVSNFGFWIFLSLVALFYADLLYTLARAGILGLWFSLIIFFLAYIWVKRKNLKSSRPTSPAGELAGGRVMINPKLLIVVGIFLIITFIIGTPIGQLAKFTLPGLITRFTDTKSEGTPEKTDEKEQPQLNQTQSSTKSPQQIVYSGTESGDIRRLVWKGGLEAWKNYPLFGTGVETFAFAYYKYKPPLHNLTSEWNFLYNKAHNEYVNYLATTGTFGLGSYLLMIGWFLTIVILRLKAEGSRLSLEILRSAQNDKPNNPLILALIAGYVSILITNFFGFSVVIMNLYLFLIPAFVLIAGGMIPQEKTIGPAKINYPMSIWQWTPVFLITIASLYMLITLFNYWRADVSYAIGYNLNRTGDYQQAYKDLHRAVELRKEPVFQDELAINNAILAVSLLSDPNKKQDPQTITTANSLAQEAISTSDQLTSKSPNNIVFWKSRVRLYFTLSQVNSMYLANALAAIEHATTLAPNDANISYNLGILHGQNNNIPKGIEILEKTVTLKPDYVEARYALGLFYHSIAVDETTQAVKDAALNQKALEQMKYINAISPQNQLAKDALKNWQ